MIAFNVDNSFKCSIGKTPPHVSQPTTNKAPIVDECRYKKQTCPWVGVLFAILLLLPCHSPWAFSQEKLPIDSLRAALSIARTNDTLRVNLLNALSVGLRNSALREAEQYAHEARALAQKLHYTRGEAEALWQQAYFASQRGNNEQALKLLQEAKVLFERHGDNAKVAKTTMNMGLVYWQQTDKTKALELVYQSIDAAEKTNDTELLINSLINVGTMVSSKGAESQAIELYERALKLADSSGNRSASAATLRALGNVYEKIRDTTKTLEYFQRALQMNEELGEQTELAATLNNLSGILRAKGDFTRSLDYARRSATIRKAADDVSGLPFSLRSLARTLTEMSKTEQSLFNEAVQIYREALAGFQRTRNNNGAASVLNELARLYARGSDLSQAAMCADSALVYATSARNITTLAESYGIAAMIAWQRGNPKQSYAWEHEARTLTDSLLHQTRTATVKQMEERLQIERFMQTKKTRSEREKEKQRLYQYLALALVILSGAIGGILYIGRVRRKMLTAEFDRASAELELLKTQLNPHFLFNALNSIKALVRIDPERSSDAIIKLSEILRFTLNYGKEMMIPLNDEMQEVKKYLELEQLRFGNRLTIEMIIAEETRTKMLPPALVLTLAENAVKHGVSKQIGASSITVTSFLLPHGWGIEVCNTGNYEPEKPEASSEHSSGIKIGGIGLYNLRKRLEATFGKNAEFVISTQNGNFVSAKIVIVDA